MHDSNEANRGIWFLQGIENGTVDSAEAYKTGIELDPVTVHFVFRFLRDKYPPTHPHAQGVMERMLDLSSTYPDIVLHSKKGELDPITEWFNDAYSMREYMGDPEGLIRMVVEKIES